MVNSRSHRAYLGYRIVGPVSGDRMLVGAAEAFQGYAACLEEAEIKREGYLSAFWFTDAIRDYCSCGQLHIKGFDGPCWSRWLWFDIDNEDDSDQATTDARRLAASIVSRYELDDDELMIFYSGSKGYHIGLPTSLWDAEPSCEFNKVCRELAESLAADAGVKIDRSIYDKCRAFRAPNSLHPRTGLHKRLIALRELQQTTAAGIKQRAQFPIDFEVSVSALVNDRASTDWQQALQQVTRARMAHQQTSPAETARSRLNRQTLQFIQMGAEKGERALRLFSAAANLAEFECPPVLAHALLTESALDSGLPPSEVKRQIECGLAAIGKKHLSSI